MPADRGPRSPPREPGILADQAVHTGPACRGCSSKESEGGLCFPRMHVLRVGRPETGPKDGGGSPHVPFHEHLCAHYMILNFLIGCRALNTSAFLCLIFLLCKSGCDISTYLISHCGD